MNEQDKKFAEFIGALSCEEDGGWSKEVWDAAWQAALDGVQTEIANENP
jgi:hypothetical protein